MRNGNGGGAQALPPQPLRILWVSDGPFHTTGYGITTEHLTRRMAEDGHRVFVYSPGAFHGGKVEWAPNLTVLGSNFGDDRWGNMTLGRYIDQLDVDLVITWLDCQGLNEYGWSAVPTYMWAPIDTFPVPEMEKAILNRAEKVLVPSRWGMMQLREIGLDSTYIPCGVDLAHYDIDAGARKRFRDRMGLSDDTFLIGMVGINSGSPDRKGYAYGMEAIKQLADAHPDRDIKAYIHTTPEGDGMALNLNELRSVLGLQSVVAFPGPMLPEGAPTGYMREVFNGMDVLLHSAITEGFGMPVVEAQACGTPVVANSCTSVTELIGPTGVPCEPALDVWVHTTTKVSLPSVANLTQGLDALIRSLPDRELVREGVMRFNQERIYEECWRPLLSVKPQRFSFDTGDRKLMLGAGHERKEGFTHHDRTLQIEGIDVGHDLNELPWPWEDNSWDYIEMSDVLEHLRANFTNVMDELWRVTAPNGCVFIHTAEAGSWQLSKDPTHVLGFSLDSLNYYDPDLPEGACYAYSDRQWKVLRKTRDSGGLVFIIQPRKTADVLEEVTA